MIWAWFFMWRARVLRNESLWGTDLATIPHLAERIGANLERIDRDDLAAVLRQP